MLSPQNKRLAMWLGVCVLIFLFSLWQTTYEAPQKRLFQGIDTSDIVQIRLRTPLQTLKLSQNKRGAWMMDDTIRLNKAIRHALFRVIQDGTCRRILGQKEANALAHIVQKSTEIHINTKQNARDTFYKGASCQR